MQTSAPENNEFRDFIQVLKRRRTQGLAMFILVFVLAGALALLLPAVYRSEAIILIEQQEIPSDLVRSTVTSFADQRIQVISQRVMTSRNLGEILEKYNLYPEESQSAPREVILDAMRSDIQLEMISADVVDPRSGKATEATIAFSLSYQNESPSLAQKVTNEIVTLFLNENLRSRAQMAEETSNFLDDEAAKLEGQVAELERKLAAFKEQNVDSLPELLERNYLSRDKTEQDLAVIKQTIESIRERKMFLESQLLAIPPYEAIYGEDGRRILSPGDRLKGLETELTAAEARYGASHPDVKRLKKEITSLRLQSGASPEVGTYAKLVEEAEIELAALEDRYSDAHPEVQSKKRELAALREQLEAAIASRENNEAETPNNPAYLSVQAQVAAKATELSTAIERRDQLEQKLEEYEDRLRNSVTVEKEYRALVREYETALAKFREISAKRLEADVSESLEREQKGERFTLIEPPLLPEEPFKPNRLAIFLVGFIVSVGAGAGVVTLLEALDDKVRGRRGVRALAGMAPIGLIPPINSRGVVEEQSGGFRRGLFVVGVGIVLLLVLIHYYWVPLDIFWFRLLRKFGFSLD